MKDFSNLILLFNIIIIIIIGFYFFLNKRDKKRFGPRRESNFFCNKVDWDFAQSCELKSNFMLIIAKGLCWLLSVTNSLSGIIEGIHILSKPVLIIYSFLTVINAGGGRGGET